MMKFERQHQILSMLSDSGVVSLKELEEKTGARRLTIQRDLVELENQHRLKRIRGGMTTVDYGLHPRSRDIREKENVTIKDRLCRKAVSLIQAGDVVGIDGSTTTQAVSRFLPDIRLTVFTTSVYAYLELIHKRNITAIISGGETNPRTFDISGALAIDSIRKFHFHTLFLSADGFNLEQGMMDHEIEVSNVKREMIRNSERVVCLIDSGKFERTNGVITAGLDEIDLIITDAGHPVAFPPDVKEKVILV
jgi:DeoR/GlpR family transcriptional regulator of sugar metabolism